MQGKVGGVGEFQVYFPFQTPFIYDRRSGQLVLAIYSLDDTGTGALMDAFATDSYSRGAYIVWELPLGGPVPLPGIIATKFVYNYPFSLVTAIRTVSSNIEMDFLVSGNHETPQIEVSSEVAGLYVIESGAEIGALPDGSWRAQISDAKQTRFYRVRFN